LKDQALLGILLGPLHPEDEDTTFFRNIRNSLSADIHNILEDNQTLSNFVLNKTLLAERLSVI